MSRKKPGKQFDAVRFMHDAQVRINRETKGMTVGEQVAYFRACAESGPLGEWWKKLETRSTARKTLKKAA